MELDVNRYTADGSNLSSTTTTTTTNKSTTKRKRITNDDTTNPDDDTPKAVIDHGNCNSTLELNQDAIQREENHRNSANKKKKITNNENNTAPEDDTPKEVFSHGSCNNSTHTDNMINPKRDEEIVEIENNNSLEDRNNMLSFVDDNSDGPLSKMISSVDPPRGLMNDSSATLDNFDTLVHKQINEFNDDIKGAVKISCLAKSITMVANWTWIQINMSGALSQSIDKIKDLFSDIEHVKDILQTVDKTDKATLLTFVLDICKSDNNFLFNLFLATND